MKFASILEDYHASLLAVWLILATMFVQSLIAMVAHRRQKSYIPGIVDANLGQESFVFRSDRCFRNSLENSLIMIACIFLAMNVGVAAPTLAWLGWIYALARIAHMGLYYAIATEKNPSPRSYFFAIGFFSTLVLLVLIVLKL
ncbi:MAPEG family protein [Agaribacterium haliotis]|uniref:MAPEG family protein n=1 Tax=Agaribacterium haliotis TaxID=2013869 RepID=UPI000BB58FAC|nr:MAPEG family protein [Agaribacterium haliotis]